MALFHTVPCGTEPVFRMELQTVNATYQVTVWHLYSSVVFSGESGEEMVIFGLRTERV